jgi:hypothetical protein
VICLDCIMAWLLFGDGAECLAGHGRVYWRPATKKEASIGERS